MEPLTVVCVEERTDYSKARLALMRGEIVGRFEGRRLIVSRESLLRWKAGQSEQVAPVPA